MWVNPDPGHTVLRQEAEAADLKVLWMTGSALADAGVMDKLTGRLWEGTIFTCFGELPDSKAPLMNTYRRGFEQFALRGERWGPFLLLRFWPGRTPGRGSLAGGTQSRIRNQFVKAMESLKNFKGILGRITYGPNRRQGQTELFLAEALKDGRSRPLTGWITPSR